MHPITMHIFKCGCRTKSYHAKNVNRDGTQYTVRLCPNCVNPALSDRAQKNKACSLAHMEGECKKCGEVTAISKNTPTNIRVVLCSRHKYLRNFMNRQLHKSSQKRTYNYQKKSKTSALCPCCEKQHSVTGTSFATKKPRIFCASCERQRDIIDCNFL